MDHQSEQYRHLREELHETQREYLVIIEAIMADCLIERSNREYRFFIFFLFSFSFSNLIFFHHYHYHKTQVSFRDSR